MLLKDNENLPLPIVLTEGPESSPGPQPFAPDLMVACQECLRSNPPTRLNCLYCGAVLPLNEATANLQKPTLRRLEKWELGYNNILSPPSANETGAPVESDLAEAAVLLKLERPDLDRIMALRMALPLARAATLDEAALVERRLLSLGIATRVVGDEDLGVSETGPARVRAMEFYESGFCVYHGSDSLPIETRWADLLLIVVGRLITTRMELKEQNAKRAENRIVDSSEFFRDETLCEFYARNHPGAFRVSANSFDFSCLGQRKGLVSGENMTTLVKTLHQHAPEAELDEWYTSLRKALESVWPSEQQIASGGWRRERPGKYSIGSVMEKSNERQFMRYSLLRHFLHLESRARVQ